MRVIAMLSLAFLLAGIPTLDAQSRRVAGPQTYSATLRARADSGVSSAFMKLHIQQYTADKDRNAVLDALKLGGYPEFLKALRTAPEVGYVELGSQKYSIRWARETDDGKVRTIVLVTDKPMYFVGGGAPDAKPRAGYEVALLRLRMDPAGIGEGDMAGAARVRPGGETGVEVEDYASEPIKLTSISRVSQLP